jgi:8-oxo-dGTP diphosphatase
MTKNPTWMAVVAAAIRDSGGRLLLQQALPGKPHAGQWEFPGGKVEPGETPRFALCREVAEELGLALHAPAMQAVGFADEAGVDGRPGIVLFLYDCREWQGEPQALEGQAWDWFAPTQAAALPMPHMDRALLEGLSR